MSTTSYDVGANLDRGLAWPHRLGRRRPGLFSPRPAGPIRRARRPWSWQKSPTRRRRACIASRATRESRRTETRRALRCAPARRGCRTRSSTRRRPTRGTSPRHPSTSRPAAHVLEHRLSLARAHRGRVRRVVRARRGTRARRHDIPEARPRDDAEAVRRPEVANPEAEILGRTDQRERERNQRGAHDDERDAAPDARLRGPSRGGTPSGEPTPILAGARR